jgi:hypothetical protein
MGDDAYDPDVNMDDIVVPDQNPFLLPVQGPPPNVFAPAPAPAPAQAQQPRRGGGRRTGGPATRQAAMALGMLDGQPARIRPTRSRAYQYVYRAHHGASKGLTAKQIRHLYRYRHKKHVSAETRNRMQQMGLRNGPALKRARLLAASQNRPMTKQDFYVSGGMRPKNRGQGNNALR